MEEENVPPERRAERTNFHYARFAWLFRGLMDERRVLIRVSTSHSSEKRLTFHSRASEWAYELILDDVEVLRWSKVLEALEPLRMVYSSIESIDVRLQEWAILKNESGPKTYFLLPENFFPKISLFEGYFQRGKNCVKLEETDKERIDAERMRFGRELFPSSGNEMMMDPFAPLKSY